LMSGQSSLTSVEGGDRITSIDVGSKGEEKIKIAFSAENSGDYAHRTIVLHFAGSRK